jgi:hypothetical protein
MSGPPLEINPPTASETSVQRARRDTAVSLPAETGATSAATPGSDDPGDSSVRVEGVVLDALGRPVRSEVSIWTPGRPVVQGDEQWIDAGPTHPDGVFSLAVEPGPIRLFARARGHAPSGVITLEAETGVHIRGVVLRLAQGSRVEVRVVDSDEVPVEDGWVTLTDSDDRVEETKQTDALGLAVFELVPPGAFAARVGLESQDGTVEGRRTVCGDTGRVSEGSTELMTLHIPRATRIVVTGHVLGLQELLGGATQTGPTVEISLMAPGGESWGPAMVGADGIYEVTLDRPGPHELFLESINVDGEPSSMGLVRSVVVPDAPQFQYDIHLEIGSVAGTVRTTSGSPLAGIAVEATSRRGFRIRDRGRAETDDEGRFRLLLPAGGFEILAGVEQADFARDRAGGVIVSPGVARTGLDFELDLASRVVGTVRRLDGSPVPGAQVHAESEVGLESWGRSDGAGRFEILGIIPGRNRITAQAERLTSRDALEIVTKPGETTEVSLTVGPMH